MDTVALRFITAKVMEEHIELRTKYLYRERVLAIHLQEYISGPNFLFRATISVYYLSN